MKCKRPKHGLTPFRVAWPTACRFTQRPYGKYNSEDGICQILHTAPMDVLGEDTRFLGPLWEGAVGEADWGRENAYYVSPSVTAKGRDTSLAEGGFRSSAPAGAAGR